MTKLYGNRDIEQLERMGRYYSKHVSAMTKEGLEGKGDIAAELAYRDMLIDQLQAAIELTQSTEHPVQMIERPRSAEDLVHEISENVKLLHAAAQAMRASMPRTTVDSDDLRHRILSAFSARIGALSNHNEWGGWPGTWPFAQVAMDTVLDYFNIDHKGETK